MQPPTIIETADKDQRDFILLLWARTLRASQKSVERRLLEDYLRFTRGKSNLIFHYWLRLGMVEGDQFGQIWLTHKGVSEVEEYEKNVSNVK